MGGQITNKASMQRKSSRQTNKSFCLVCLYSDKGSTICCGKKMMSVNYRIRFPSKSASKNRWKKFCKDINIVNWGNVYYADLLATFKARGFI